MTNTEITPRSYNLKQLKNASGQFSVQDIPITSSMQHFFYTSCLFRFASVKFAITGLLRRKSKVKTVNYRALKNSGNKIEVQAFSFTCIFYLKYSRHFCREITFIRLSYFFSRPSWKECIEKKEQKGTRWNLKTFTINSISKSKNDILILEYSL